MADGARDGKHRRHKGQRGKILGTHKSSASKLRGSICFVGLLAFEGTKEGGQTGVSRCCVTPQKFLEADALPVCERCVKGLLGGGDRTQCARVLPFRQERWNLGGRRRREEARKRRR